MREKERQRLVKIQSNLMYRDVGQRIFDIQTKKADRLFEEKQHLRDEDLISSNVRANNYKTAYNLKHHCIVLDILGSRSGKYEIKEEKRLDYIDDLLDNIEIDDSYIENLLGKTSGWVDERIRNKNQNILFYDYCLVLGFLFCMYYYLTEYDIQDYSISDALNYEMIEYAVKLESDNHNESSSPMGTQEATH